MSQYERAALLSDGGIANIDNASPTASSGHGSSVGGAQHHRGGRQPAAATSSTSSLAAGPHQYQPPQHQHHHRSHYSMYDQQQHHRQQLQQSNNNCSSDDEDVGAAAHSLSRPPKASTSFAGGAPPQSTVADWSSGGSYTSTVSSSPFDDSDDDGDGDRDRHPAASDTDSYTPDWEPYVQSDGSLFYIEYDEQPATSAATQTTAANAANKPTLSRSATRRSNSAKKPISIKLSSLMNRNLKKGFIKTTPSSATATAAPASTISVTPSTTSTVAASAVSVKFHEITEGEIKQLRCIVDPAQRHKFGRRASVAEALLGISVSPFQDGRRLMIAGYMPAHVGSGLGAPEPRRHVKVGDWLKAIDGQEVTTASLDSVLLSFVRRTEVLVTLQRMSGERQSAAGSGGPTSGIAAESTSAAAALLNQNRVASWSEMAANARQIMRAESLVDAGCSSTETIPPEAVATSTNTSNANGMVLSVMYLTLKDANESAGADGQDVLFCYPERSANVLYAARGSFLTLHSLLSDEMYAAAAAGPQLTTISVHGCRYHVVYRAAQLRDDCCHSGGDIGGGGTAAAPLGDAGDILLVAVAAAHATAQAARARAAELAQCMQFVHQKLGLALTNPANHRHWAGVCAMLALQLRLAPHAERLRRFEAQLVQSEWLPMPKEVQRRVDEALGEMEAMDYREWNDRPLRSHREFYVVGGAVWWSGYLVGTHLPAADVADVEVWLRVHGVLRMLEVRTVREMLVWQEVYPRSVERGLVQQNCAYGIPQGRWFLACVARGRMLLAVLLEARHDGQDVLQPHVTPSPFYIEEIQDTFEVLQASGVAEVADMWMRCNRRPQVLGTGTEAMAVGASEATMASGMGDTSGHQLQQHPLMASAGVQPPIAAKKAEIISILKRRNNSTENVYPMGEEGSNVGKLSSPPSIVGIGGGGGGGGSASVNSQTFSEDSNHADDSDSDWDGFPDSQRSSSGYELSEHGAAGGGAGIGAGGTAEQLLRDIGDVMPGKITAGPENVLYHYVHIDCGQGVFVAAPGRTPTDPIMVAFRSSCRRIHAVLQNTVRAWYALTNAAGQLPQQQAGGGGGQQRALVAIKEHGILMSVPNGADGSGSDSTEFWVIGRLFQSPPKELYVCHRADVPQNMVEIAFRLSMVIIG